MNSTLYAPQRVNYKPTAPAGLPASIDPRKVLLESLKKLMDKKQQGIMNQNPSAVMGAITNPKDVASGMKGNILGGVETRAKMMGGR
ncbi:hypothetical protein UFOVP1158_39 [uncultured Caudovirales phage]|uniref:Uncharacterized protein n=1 Tax=uncultured Caudovirales phage TaxID=2100421 RepID=A0A6J5QSI2_9CAUD|nr:hypothetical protein UFOVP1158_39 [uncultured Caudovirales phage]